MKNHFDHLRRAQCRGRSGFSIAGGFQKSLSGVRSVVPLWGGGGRSTAPTTATAAASSAHSVPWCRQCASQSWCRVLADVQERGTNMRPRADTPACDGGAACCASCCQRRWTSAVGHRRLKARIESLPARHKRRAAGLGWWVHGGEPTALPKTAAPYHTTGGVCRGAASGATLTGRRVALPIGACDFNLGGVCGEGAPRTAPIGDYPARVVVYQCQQLPLAALHSAFTAKSCPVPLSVWGSLQTPAPACDSTQTSHFPAPNKHATALKGLCLLQAFERRWSQRVH